jgi:hypothetical protein
MRWGALHRSPLILEQRLVLAARELELSGIDVGTPLGAGVVWN